MPLCETRACYPNGNVSDYYLTNIYTWNSSTFQCAPKTGTQQKLQTVLLLSHFHNCVLSTYFSLPPGTDGVLFQDDLGQNHRSRHLTPPTHSNLSLNKTHNCELGGCKKLEMLSNRKLDSYNHSAAPLPSFWSPKMRRRKSSTILGSPSFKATLGSHPSNSFAFEMSGFLMCGSSAVLARCSIFAFGSTTFFTTCTGQTSLNMKQS